MTLRRRLALLATAAAVLACPAAAAAHVQVTPTEAAPDDAVRFEVLVPNERDVDTTEVALQIPAGVLPFSYEETPGWRRTLEKGDDGSTEVVRWRGAVAPEGFVRFSFLAATPPEATEIAWKALQTYADGEIARWIGDEQAEFPAAVTRVSASAPRANAGGESAPAEGSEPAPGAAPATVAPVERGRDVLTLGLAIAALAAAVGALGVALRRRA